MSTPRLCSRPVSSTDSVPRNRTEAQLRSIQEKQERKKMEIMQLQQAGSQIEGGPSQ